MRTRANQDGCRGGGRSAAFTLIELILVMVLLLTVVGVSMPTLSRFFRSRTLDSEARRMLALTRYGQSRAVSEGIPVVLWVDERQGGYGLEQDPAFVRFDTNAVEFEVGEDLSLEVVTARVSATNRLFGSTAAGVRMIPGRGQLPTVRFEPDGGVTAGSLEAIRIVRAAEGRGGEGTDEDALWVARGRTRLSYEIQTNLWLWSQR